MATPSYNYAQQLITPDSTAKKPEVNTNLSYNPSAAPTPASDARSKYTQSLSTPSYGSTFYDPKTGQAAGTNKFDPATGQALTDPNATNGATGSSAYQKYLDSFNSDTANSYRTSSENANKRLTDIQNEEDTKSLNFRHQYQDTLDKSGGLVGGAQQSAQVLGRRNNAELADLAVREGAAARSAQVASDTYKQYIDAGKSAYEAQLAAEKAKKDDEQQNFTNDLASKKFEEDKRQFGLDYALKQQQLALDKQKAGAANTNTTLTDNSLSSAFQLLNQFDNGGSFAVGGSRNIGGGLASLLSGTQSRDFVKQFDNFKSLAALNNVKYLKGQGQVSDAERNLLNDATKLDLTQSDSEFRKSLLAQIKLMGGTVPDEGDKQYDSYLQAIGISK